MSRYQRTRSKYHPEQVEFIRSLITKNMNLADLKNKLESKRQWWKKHWFLNIFRQIYLFFYRTYYQLKDDMPMQIRHAWQRVTKGFDNTWHWGLSETLNEILPQVLKELKEYGMGVPYNEEEKRSFTEQEWHGILDRMIKGFEAGRRIDTLQFMEGEDGKLLDPEIWKKRHDEAMTEFNEGMKLFHKYYFSLWD